MSTTMTDIQVAVDSYIAAWNETEETAQARLVALAVSEDASYVDPLVSGSGQEGVRAMIVAAQAMMPGHVLRRTSEIDRYQDRVRFSWDVVKPDGSLAFAGTDFAVLAPDGRMQAITGFFDTMLGE